MKFYRDVLMTDELDLEETNPYYSSILWGKEWRVEFMAFNDSHNKVVIKSISVNDIPLPREHIDRTASTALLESGQSMPISFTIPEEFREEINAITISYSEVITI